MAAIISTLFVLLHLMSHSIGIHASSNYTLDQLKEMFSTENKTYSVIHSFANLVDENLSNLSTPGEISNLCIILKGRLLSYSDYKNYNIFLLKTINLKNTTSLLALEDLWIIPDSKSEYFRRSKFRINFKQGSQYPRIKKLFINVLLNPEYIDEEDGLRDMLYGAGNVNITS